jgi:hypothetical protein
MTVTEKYNPQRLGCFVRVGIHGHVGRFHELNAGSLSRGDQVVCRTPRGLEVGLVLGPASFRDSDPGDAPPAAVSGTAINERFDGRVLRKLTAEDQLLWEQLQRMGRAAHQACEDWLSDQQISATLLEVEPLFDGRTLYFHFLSDVPPEVQLQLDSLVAIYEAEVKQSQFARLLEHGCGPGCGTEKAENGCSTGGGCAVCSVAASCGVRQR